LCTGNGDPGSIAKAAGPIVAALLYVRLGGYQTTLHVLIALALASAAVFALASRRRAKPTID
jgi:hypothetical protein